MEGTLFAIQDEIETSRGGMISSGSGNGLAFTMAPDGMNSNDYANALRSAIEEIERGTPTPSRTYANIQ